MENGIEHMNKQATKKKENPYRKKVASHIIIVVTSTSTTTAAAGALEFLLSQQQTEKSIFISEQHKEFLFAKCYPCSTKKKTRHLYLLEFTEHKHSHFIFNNNNNNLGDRSAGIASIKLKNCDGKVQENTINANKTGRERERGGNISK